MWQTENSAPEIPPSALDLQPRAQRSRASTPEVVLQTWNAPATPIVPGKRPRAMWSIDTPILKYTLRHVHGTTTPPPAPEPRPQAPSPPAKRVRATRPDGSPLLPEGWREEVRTPASGREYRVYLGPDSQMADSRVKAWEAFERAKQGLPLRGQAHADDDGGGGKRKRSGGSRARICLACDLGRKRRCTCGKRTRRW